MTARLVAAALLALGLALPAAVASADDAWVSLGSRPVDNVSGLAAYDDGWVLVRDNKRVGQSRIALLDTGGRVTSLAWPGGLPKDLEAVSAVPGQADTFAAVTSGRQGYVVRVSGGAVQVQRGFTVPAGSQVEGFALTSSSGRTVAVWASRGSTSTPATMFAATFDPGSGSFGARTQVKVRVPWPTTAVRHVSDLAVTRDRVLVTSASDPGAGGPFASAAYDVGTLGWSGAKPLVRVTGPVELARWEGRKVEGLACGAGGRGLVGTDDERSGGAVLDVGFCPVGRQATG